MFFQIKYDCLVGLYVWNVSLVSLGMMTDVGPVVVDVAMEVGNAVEVRGAAVGAAVPTAEA